MTENPTKQPIRVFAGAESTGWFIARVDELPEVRAILEANRIRHSISEDQISLNDQPAFSVVILKRGTDAAAVQRLLDARI
jgi:hypothetical protein